MLKANTIQSLLNVMKISVDKIFSGLVIADSEALNLKLFLGKNTLPPPPPRLDKQALTAQVKPVIQRFHLSRVSLTDTPRWGVGGG